MLALVTALTKHGPETVTVCCTGGKALLSMYFQTVWALLVQSGLAERSQFHMFLRTSLCSGFVTEKDSERATGLPPASLWLLKRRLV